MSNEAEKKTTLTQVKSKSLISSRCIIKTIFLVILFIVVILGGFLAYQRTLQSYKKLAINVVSLQENMQTSTLAVQQLKQDMNHLSQTIPQLLQAQQNTKDDLNIAQANYYVQLANENLQYRHSIPLAITLLKMSDDTIRNMADPAFDDARKAIADDIANLQTIPQIDITGIYLRLTALDNQLDKLPMQISISHPVSNNADTSWWQQGWRATWQSLQKIIIVKHYTPGELSLITDKALLYQNLHLMVEQSTWALLHRDATIYEKSLQQMNEWITKYFLPDSPITQGIVKELSDLQKINIGYRNVNITDSLQAFEKLNAMKASDKTTH